MQLVQFNYFHLQINSLAVRKLPVVLLINSRFLLSLLCCGGAGEYLQRENEVSDELHAVIFWKCIYLGLPPAAFKVSPSSMRIDRSEIVDYDEMQFSGKYGWGNGNVTNYRWTLSQCFSQSLGISQKFVVQMRPFGKGVFETWRGWLCPCLYPGTGEHFGAACGAQKVSEHSIGKTQGQTLWMRRK